MHPFVSLGPVRLGSFTLCFGAGLMMEVLIVLWQFRRFKVPPAIQNLVLPAIPLALVAGIASAAASEVVLCGGWRALLAAPSGYGINFFGFLLGGLAFLGVYARCSGVRFRFLANLFLPAVAVAQGFGRIGCFLGGCCWGRPAPHGWGVVFPAGSLPHEMFGATPLIPVQLIESAWLFAAVAWILTSVRFRSRAAWYFILAGAGRFALEFLRGDVRGEVWPGCPLSPAQCVGLALVLAGAILARRNPRPERDRG